MRHMLLACLLVSACTLKDGSQVETFGYVFHETTGIPTSVFRDGKEITIQFTPDSDPAALRTLTSLDWSVLHPNADGRHIFVEGYLDSEVRWTPNVPERATSEPYQAFRLVNWHINTPYERLTLVNEALPHEFTKVLRERLEPSDFASKEAIEGADLARFQRKVAPMNTTVDRPATPLLP